jgi:putative membrane protein
MLASMTLAFVIIGSVFTFLAALFHLYVFFLESITWTKPRTWKIFGIASQADADTIKPMAFNQGFYNLFLALGAGIGLVLISNYFYVALGFIVMSLGSMFLAGVVLFFSVKGSRRSAMLQAIPPLIGLVFVLLSFTVRA